MIQLIAVAAAFLFTLFMILGGIANIQDNLGEYRRQLDAEGFEGITIGYINQTVLKSGGLTPFLRANCPTDDTKNEFNPKIRVNCFGAAGVKSIFNIDPRLSTNALRTVQGIDVIKADQSEIRFEFQMTQPGSELWSFVAVPGDVRLMSLSYLEVKAFVILKKDGSDVDVFEFRRIFRP